MVRTLPWLKNGQQKHLNAPTTKRRRIDNASVSPPPSSRSTSVASSRATKPSTNSDINEEYMIAGLSADDQYIMVEDQLYALARSYTSQLHASEYARRKALASSTPHPFPNSITRYVSTPSALPHERKIANKATAHKRAVISSTTTKEAELDASWLSEDEDEEEAVRQMLKAEGDNASGTVWAKGALGKLMRGSSSQSLKVERKLGVVKGRTKTRAAAGFTAGNASSPTRGQVQQQTQPPSSPLRGKVKKEGKVTVKKESESESGDEDLDIDGGDLDLDDGSDRLDITPPPPPPPKKRSDVYTMKTSVTSKSPPQKSRAPPPRPQLSPTLSSPPPKSILKKPTSIIELSSDSDEMDAAEAERWKRRRQEQERRDAKAEEKRRAAEEEEKRKRETSAAPLSFLGLKYS